MKRPRSVVLPEIGGPSDPPPSGTWVYFIQGDGGPVKIGSARRPYDRICSLQVGNPARLRLVGVLRASAIDEADLHARFGSLRVRGEWFAAAPELVAFISSLSRDWSAAAEAA